MSERANAFATIEATERGLRALDRIKERFHLGALPAALTLAAGSESGISDIYMNLNRQLADGKLEEKTKLLVAVGIASVAGKDQATELFAQMAQAAGRTAHETLDAASVGAICSIFNGYYRFRDQIPAESLPTYEAFRAPFNANSFMKTSLNQMETEAICIAVSSVNNCHKCVEGHMSKGKSLGMTDEQIDELIKVAAVVLATANLVGALSGMQAPVAPSPAA